MSSAVFFHNPEVAGLLERAARCAAVPLSVHFTSEDQEGPKLCAWGSCAVCKYVNNIPEGRKACRESRVEASMAAVVRDKPTPFICHMGFACTAVPAIGGSGFIITFGPYCPSEAPESLENDVHRGFKMLEQDTETEPDIDLSDIRIVPSDAIPEIAKWTVEKIRALWKTERDLDEENEDPVIDSVIAKPRRKISLSRSEPYQSSAIAATIVGNDHAKARELVLGAISESQALKRPKLAVRRARAVAIVAATLEAAERAGIDTSDCQQRFNSFHDDNAKASTDDQLTTTAMRFLAYLKRKVIKTSKRKGKSTQTGADQGLKDLNKIIMGRLMDGITLNEVAAELGQHPTAITHRLQRKFDMSFSEYLGKLRVNKAKEILRRTKLSIGEVARRIGIKDTSNFGKIFRKFEGISPKKYRDKYGRKK